MVKTATFERGIHPEYQKEITSNKPITSAQLPSRVVIPLSQHTGAPAKPEVNIGDEVKRGQLIGSPPGFVSAPVHASISGKVTAIAEFLHPSGRMISSVVIESDGKDESISFKENVDYMSLGIEEIKTIIKDAGIVGLGGAAFPTNVKLSPPKEKPIDMVILNGAEKMLIKAIKGREVPSRGLPMDVGVVVQNVGTALAIYEAVKYGKPLIERVVTVTGKGIKEPKNLMVRIGTLISDVVGQCGGFVDGAVKVIVGGPMMGFAQGSLDVPVVKGTSGILVLTEDEYVSSEEYFPCIRCGNCIDVCPVGLNPSMLSILSEKGRYEETKEYNLFDCFECGSCAFVCPANRPMVQFMRLAKSMVK